MPSITLTVTAAQAVRIQAALSPTSYPQTLAGFKQLLVDYSRHFVQEYERAEAQKAALVGIAKPADFDVL